MPPVQPKTPPSSIRIDPDGTIHCLYSDQLQPFLSLGPSSIRRASHVEPTPDGQWTADLTPIHGPILGPFPLRQQALHAEVEWIATYRLRGVPNAQ